jgi:asparagine synthase (glutamine-hydrolysing)
MCGLAGVVDLGGLDRDAVEPCLERAIERLGPRGPDSRGRWFDPDCALGHTRLAVIDLSPEADQPMAGHGLVVAYNGEIYNFAALRSELEDDGASFRTRSDTEVLLAGWRRWGEALLPRLSGMFAFALWDPARRALVLARDRFGKKPLVWARDGRRLSFASDAVALDRLRGGAGDIDPRALRLLFTLRYLPEPWSIRAGVERLPPGHFLRLDGDGLAISRWYDLARQPLPSYSGDEAALADLARRFDRAVADRLVAEVPLGVFLSGGIDSALVAASMVRRAGKVRSFTVGFEGATAYYEERPAARALARHLGTEHVELAVGAGEAEAALDAVFDGLDEPFADSSAVPTYLLARAARTEVTVALSGDGADEVFGGYRKYRAERFAGFYRALPRPLRRGLVEPLVAALPEAKGRPGLEAVRRLRRFVAHAGKPASERQAGLNRLLDESALDALLIDSAEAPSLERMVEDLRAASGAGDSINAMLAADIALGLPGDMLVKVDRMSMACGLEVRCPFLDHRVVECAAALPGRLKVGARAGKLALRRAFADRLPAAVFARPKKGFEIPIAAWLTGPLAELTRRAIDPARLTAQGLFRPELPAAWYAALESGRRDTSEALWTLVAFQAWYERHGTA